MRRAAAALTTLSAAVVLAGCSAGAVEVPAPSPGAQAQEPCRALVDGAPETLFDQQRAEVEPETPYAAAWGDPPIALRCGVERPAELRPTSELTSVEGIDWLPGPPERPNLYTAVGRGVYVELSIPPSYGAPAEGLVAISDLIEREVPARPGGEL